MGRFQKNCKSETKHEIILENVRRIQINLPLRKKWKHFERFQKNRSDFATDMKNEFQLENSGTIGLQLSIF